MSLSTRLTRAGLALLVFGVLSAVLPSTAATYAASNQCSSSSNNVSEADVAIGVVVVGGGIIGYTAAHDQYEKRRHDH